MLAISTLICLYILDNEAIQTWVASLSYKKKNYLIKKTFFPVAGVY